MQKKLIALAVASLVSGGAFAQSSVTIFGIVDAGIEVGKYSDAVGNLTRMQSGMMNTTRLGFRGTEDLGKGLSAQFLLETQPTSDNGTHGVPITGTTNQMWNRSTTVGLKSTSWGQVNLGRQYVPWFNAVYATDVFYAVGAGNNYQLVAGDTRMNNSIRYDSPSMSGFSIAAMYGLGESAVGLTAMDRTGVEGVTAVDKNLGRETGISLSYANGPISANYGYDTQILSNSPDVSMKRNALNGAYDFKVVKVYLGYNSNKQDRVQDDRVWTITAKMPVFGADLIKFGYTRLTNKLVANADIRLIAIGYEHNMSKRTALYATYAIKNNDSASASTTTGGAAIAAGYDPRVLQAGIRHSF